MKTPMSHPRLLFKGYRLLYNRQCRGCQGRTFTQRKTTNPSASVHRKRFFTPSLTPKFLCAGYLNRGKKIDWPHLINDNEIMSIGSARPLIDALRLACVDMVNWLVSDYGFEKYEAVQLLGQAAHLYVANVVDPQFSAACALNKKYLPK